MEKSRVKESEMDVSTWEVNPHVLFGSFVSDPTEDLHGEWVQVKERRNPKARPANIQGQAKKVVKKEKGVKKAKAQVRQIT